MLGKLFPERFDNNYRGWRIALWLFGFSVAVRMFQSLAIIFNGRTTVVNADGIPLETYPPEAGQTILALFAQSSLWRLLVCVLGVLVLVRYRTAVPIMFVILMLSFLGAQLLAQFVPLVRVGTPPGTIVNLVLFATAAAGLVLSMLDARRR